MLEDIKIDKEYFDSDYRIFYEDLDIAWRANKFGWKAFFVPGALAYHVRGQTVRSKVGVNKKYARFYLSDDLQFDLLKNRYLTIIKNESLVGFVLHLPFIILYDVLAWCYFLIFRFKSLGKVIMLKEVFKSALKKRKAIKDKLNKI